MKFTIITRFYHPTPDGIGHHSSYIHQHLTALGHQVQVIYDDGLVTIEANKTDLLLNKIKRQKSDWVIFQYNGYSYNRFGAPHWLSHFYKKIHHLEGTKLCLIIHETYIRKEDSIKLKIYRFLQKRALKAASKYADLLLTTTHLYQSQLKEMGRKSKLFFTPSNFENYFRNLSLEESTRSELILGTFGNRNPEFLLLILEALENKKLPCQFHFIGHYPLPYVKLIKECMKKFKFVQISRSGKLTDRNIVEYLVKLNAFILLEPVREDEGGGLNTKSGSSATALGMGIPIFSTKGDFTHPQVFKENENYILLDHHDAAKSAEVIYNFSKNIQHFSQIGLNGKKLYHEAFSWERYVSDMLEQMKSH